MKFPGLNIGNGMGINSDCTMLTHDQAEICFEEGEQNQNQWWKMGDWESRGRGTNIGNNAAVEKNYNLLGGFGMIGDFMRCL